MELQGSGDGKPGAGRGCPAPNDISSAAEGGKRVYEDGCYAEVGDVADAISRFLRWVDTAGARGGGRMRLAVNALRFALTLLVVCGVQMGFADGDEFDDVGCTVAQQPGGTARDVG